ncbi:MAG: Gfo/Idh/MocA family oxidoreductase, partial [Ignavibacteriaceae bacterium]
MNNSKSRRSKKIKWGVAGCGKFAEFSFIPNLLIARRGSLNAVFSNNLQRAKEVGEKFGVLNFYNNFDEFLQSDINAVYVSSANSHHYEQVIKAAEAKKNIFCEKPLAVTSQQAKEMVEACNKNNVLLAVDYVHRAHPLIIKAKEIVDSQMLGKLLSVNVNFNIDIPPSSNFRYSKTLSGGGALRDIGTHMIDLLRFFGGEIKSINGVVDNIIYKAEVDDFASAIVGFEKSGYGYFNVSYSSKKGFNRIEILGHKGALSIEKLIANKHVPSKMTILLDGEAKKS